MIPYEGHNISQGGCALAALCVLFLFFVCIGIGLRENADENSVSQNNTTTQYATTQTTSASAEDDPGVVLKQHVRTPSVNRINIGTVEEHYQWGVSTFVDNRWGFSEVVLWDVGFDGTLDFVEIINERKLIKISPKDKVWIDRYRRVRQIATEGKN